MFGNAVRVTRYPSLAGKAAKQEWSKYKAMRVERHAGRASLSQTREGC
jgi:hypothetical protein